MAWPNGLANFFSGMLFLHGLKNTTCVFKACRESCLDGLRLFLSPHLSLTMDPSLKAIIRG